MGDLMKDDEKTKKQLVSELTELRSQNAVLKKSITGSMSAEFVAEEAGRYAESIVETVREPLLVLDAELKIISANRNFYRTFKVTPGETIGSFIYDLGNKQWDIPKLRELLEETLPQKEAFDDFEVAHDFPDSGHKIMLLNARRIYREDIGAKMIFLAIEDITKRKRAEEKLLFRNVLLSTQQEASLDGILVVDEKNRILSYNRRFVELWGLPAKLVEDRADEPVLQFVTAQMADPPSFLQRVQYLYEHRRETSRDELVLADGRFFDRYSAPMVGSDKRYFGRVWYFRDITEHKRVEGELSRVNRALRMLSDTNQALIHITDEATLLNEVCRIAVDVGGYRLAWVGFTENDEAKTVRPVAHAGFESGYIESANVTWADDERGRGPGGTAIRTGLPCVVRNIPVDPSFAPWREEATRRGYKSIIALPLIIEGQTFGAIGIYSVEADAFDAKEVEILKELADDLAFGITALRTRAKRDLAEEALRHSEKEKTIRNQIASIFLTIPDEEMYGEVLDFVLRVMNSRFGIFGYIGEKGDLVIPSLTRDILRECQVPGKSIVFPSDSWGDSLWGRAIREKKSFSSDGPFHTPEGHVRIDHFLAIPVVYGQESIGLISVANKEGGYTHEDKDLLERIAGYVSPILNARLQRDMQERKRKRVEEALVTSESKYRNIFENAMEGIYQATPEGRFNTVNAAFARMAGYDSPEELIEAIEDIGTHLYIHPEDHKKFLEIMVARGIVEGFEVDFFKKNGSTFWVLVNSRAVKDDQGEILYFEGIIEDITLRKQAEKKLQQTLENLRKAFSATVQVLVSAVESRDPYTSGHQLRSADLAQAMATEMGLPQDRIDGTRMAGSIHDIGKMSVPSEILSKPIKLTEIEFSLIKEHARTGYEMLKDVESPWPLAEIVYQHHERMDGSGYPMHLKGEEIIMEARILAVADVVEAMASYRPYRPALGLNAALAEIENHKGTLYDADAVDACLRLFREKGFQLEGV